MKAAVFSDVHGNAAALEAVLADAETVGVDEVWVVGDLVAHGPNPAATLQRLMRLPAARFVRGNTDRYVLYGELPGMLPSVDDATTPADVQLLLDVSRTFAWTRGAITSVGGYDWLQGLPIEQRVELPDGTRVLMVHASPGTDDGDGLQPGMTDDDFIAAGVADSGADLIFVGHTHIPLDRTVAGVRVVNLGSVSVHATADKRAMWTLLTTDDAGFAVERRYVGYDLRAVIHALDTEHYPSADWLRRKFQGAGE